MTHISGTMPPITVNKLSSKPETGKSPQERPYTFRTMPVKVPYSESTPPVNGDNHYLELPHAHIKA